MTKPKYWISANSEYRRSLAFVGVFWSTHPICLLVDGAWVMTELDWGEGRACWMTMLVSWLPIREWDCWCWPWPPWLCSWMFFRGEWKEEKHRKHYVFAQASNGVIFIFSFVFTTTETLTVFGRWFYAAILTGTKHFICKFFLNYSEERRAVIKMSLTYYCCSSL